MSHDDTILEQADISGTPEEVFRYWTDASLLTQWFPSEVEFDAKLGGQYLFRWAHDSGNSVDQRGEITAYEPGVRIAFTWDGNPHGKELDGKPRGRIETLVEVAFEAHDGGTRVRLSHTGWLPDDPVSVEEIASHRDGWCFFMGNLDKVMSEGEDRRKADRGMVVNQG